jgi:hypothetical protein
LEEIISEVFETAKMMFQGHLSSDAEELLREMCAGAAQELAARLKKGVSIEEIRAQFIRAAATLGLSNHIRLHNSSGDFSGFSAGSLRVDARGAREVDASANSLRRQAELMLMGLLSDGGFAFQAVKG